MLPLPLLTLSLWLRVYSYDTGGACYSETAVGLVRTMDLRTWQQAIRPRAAAAYVHAVSYIATKSGDGGAERASVGSFCYCPQPLGIRIRASAAGIT